MIKENKEIENLLAVGKKLKKANFGGVDHLTHINAIKQYIRIVDILLNYINPSSKILDWGGGIGQLSYLLKSRGFDVSYFAVGQKLPDEFVFSFPDLAEIAFFHDHEFILPFDDDSYDVVVSCGVLEHVPLLSESIKEIRRVLKTNGLFLVFHFPNRYSYTEYLATIRKVSTHSRKFTKRELFLCLTNTGLKVEKIWMANFFPKNFTGIPENIKSIYNLFNLETLDRLICMIPVVNMYSHSIECVSRKVEDMI